MAPDSSGFDSLVPSHALVANNETNAHCSPQEKLLSFLYFCWAAELAGCVSGGQAFKGAGGRSGTGEWPLRVWVRARSVELTPLG